MALVQQHRAQRRRWLSRRFRRSCSRRCRSGPFTYLHSRRTRRFRGPPHTPGRAGVFGAPCVVAGIPFRILGVGCNVLVPDEGFRGVVIRLTEPSFTQVSVQGKRVTASSGAALSAVISESARHGLAGLDTLVGIPATIGGALRCNAGERSEEIRRLCQAQSRCWTSMARRRRESVKICASTIAAATWMSRSSCPRSSSSSPTMSTPSSGGCVAPGSSGKLRNLTAFSHQRGCSRIHRGMNAAALISQAGLIGTKVGGAEVSERDANFVVTLPETKAHRCAALDRNDPAAGAGAYRNRIGAGAGGLVSQLSRAHPTRIGTRSRILLEAPSVLQAEQVGRL